MAPYPSSLPALDSHPSSCFHTHSPMSAPAQIKDASKRKRVNRIAKLKQCKLDARREQWLSQGKNGKTDVQRQHVGSATPEENRSDPGEVIDPEEHSSRRRFPEDCSNEGFKHSVTSTRDSSTELKAGEEKELAKRSPLRMKRSESIFSPHDEALENDKAGTLELEYEELSRSTMNCISDLFEADSSPKSCGDNSPRSKVTKLGRDFGGGRSRSASKQVEKRIERDHLREEGNGGENFSYLSDNPSSSSFGTSNASVGYFAKGAEEGGHNLDSGDDWEAAADALDLQTASRGKESVSGDSTIPSSPHRDPLKTGDNWGTQPSASLSLKMEYGILMPEYKCKPNKEAVKLRSASGRAWRLDDTCRPNSLPSLTKQQSLPTRGSSQAWSLVQKSLREHMSTPTHCPICTEELDSTDSSFVPCLCGFRLCLFCHHRIAADDGRCPGCRKVYNNDVATKLSHSLSLCRRP